LAARGSTAAFGCKEVTNTVDSNRAGEVDNRVRYAFRRPRFPLIWTVGNELVSATSPAVFQREIRRLDLQGVTIVDMVDATGEGWAFHPELMIVSPLTIKKRWKKLEVIRLFNKSDSARRIGAVYPEAYIPRRSVGRIIAEVAALAAYAQPNKALQRPGARVARAGR
jgi:hypothetical protein